MSNKIKDAISEVISALYEIHSGIEDEGLMTSEIESNLLDCQSALNKVKSAI